jgi:hypothetical protein
MHKTFRSALVLFLLCALWSCKKDPEQPDLPTGGSRVFIVCEGAYGSGNSALSLYRSDSGRIVEDAFRAANGSTLGDVFQSMIRLRSGSYLLCVNNSDKLIRIDGTSLKQTGALSVRQPRYAQELPSGEVVVTTMYSKKAYRIDAGSMQLVDSIILPFENPEGMTLAGGKLWICPWDTACRSVYAFDPLAKTPDAPLTLPGAAPSAVLTDKDGMLWVLSGNSYKGVESWLTRINPVSGVVLKQFRFGAADPVRPILNTAKDSLYFIEVSYTGGSTNNGVYRMGINDAALPATPFIPASGVQYFWGLGIDPRTNELYVADPLGFTQRGRIAVYDREGKLLRSFNSGVGPGQFCFD